MPGPVDDDRGQQELAKLSRPRLYDAVARQRLFRAIDMGRARPALWISGPPGAGKTTLVASYLEHGNCPHIWYQADPGDADVSTFFFYLTQAASRLFGDDCRLPLFTPEYLVDLDQFARRYFRAIYRFVPTTGALVLDNFQDVPLDAPLRHVLSIALNELPPGRNIFVLSREVPGHELARDLANGAIAEIGWDQLRLTQEEATVLAASRGICDADRARVLHERSDGWVAGLILMTERTSTEPSRTDDAVTVSRDRLFDYFASQVFGLASRTQLDTLLLVQLFPTFDRAMAEALTGHRDAGPLLDQLYRRQLFTYRSADDEPQYRFHALFQGFLSARFRLVHGTEECRHWESRAASILAARGLHEPAVALYVRAGDWTALMPIIRSQAPALLAQGRWLTLIEWIEAVPEPERARDGWLGYWLGCARTQCNLEQARRELTNAFETFGDGGDVVGQLTAAAALVNNYYYEYNDWAPLDRWIDEIERLLRRGPEFPDSSTELGVYAALLIGITFRLPGHALRERCAQRVAELLMSDAEPSQRASAAIGFIAYCGLAMDLDRAYPVIPRLEALMGSSAASPLNQAFWLLNLGYFYHLQADRPASTRCFDRAEAVAREHGLPQPEVLSKCFRVYHDACWFDFRQAERLVGEIREIIDPARPMDIAQYHLACTCLTISRGTGDREGLHVRPGFDLAERLGSPTLNMIWLSLGAHALILSGDPEQGLAWVERAWQSAEGNFLNCFRPYLTLIRAWEAHARRDMTACRAHMRDAFSAAGMTHGRWLFRWTMACKEPLFADALRVGLEVDYVGGLIRAFRAVPPVGAPQNWPWRIRIRTLGCFRIQVDDRTLEFGHKMPRKPLALLKALISRGTVNVTQQTLIDDLWPEEDGDKAHEAFTLNVHRLRRLLQDAGAVRVVDGLVSLDRTICWVDCVAFEDSARSELEDADEARRHYGRLRDWCRGDFLPDDTSEFWSLPARRRLREKYVRELARVGQRLEDAEQFETAIDCYIRGTELSGTAENHYQGHMRCLIALGRHAEAMDVYRQLQRSLLDAREAQPTAATRQLADSLRIGWTSPT